MKSKSLKIVVLISLFFFGSCSKFDDVDISNQSVPGVTSDVVGNLSGDDVPINTSVDSIAIIQAIEDFSEIDFSNSPRPINESQAELETSELMTNSINLLTTTYELSNSEVLDVFDDLDNPEIAYAALGLVLLEEIDISSLGSNLCESEVRWVKCATQALLPCDFIDVVEDEIKDGIIENGLKEAWDSFDYSAKKKILRVLGKYGVKRLSGAIGLALAVRDFHECITSVTEPVEGEPVPDPSPENPQNPGNGNDESPITSEYPDYWSYINAVKSWVQDQALAGVFPAPTEWDSNTLITAIDGFITADPSNYSLPINASDPNFISRMKNFVVQDYFSYTGASNLGPTPTPPF